MWMDRGRQSKRLLVLYFQWGSWDLLRVWRRWSSIALPHCLVLPPTSQLSPTTLWLSPATASTSHFFWQSYRGSSWGHWPYPRPPWELTTWRLIEFQPLVTYLLLPSGTSPWVPQSFWLEQTSQSLPPKLIGIGLLGRLFLRSPWRT